MDKDKNKETNHRLLFLKRMILGSLIAFLLLLFSLFLGMLGYHHFEKMEWIDAFVNAAMILSGMGPVGALQTFDGKLFAGFYALYSGVAFLVAMAVVLAPILHHFIHKYKLDSLGDKK